VWPWPLCPDPQAHLAGAIRGPSGFVVRRNDLHSELSEAGREVHLQPSRLAGEVHRWTDRRWRAHQLARRSGACRTGIEGRGNVAQQTGGSEYGY
jgi:hypothetical protein